MTNMRFRSLLALLTAGALALVTSGGLVYGQSVPTALLPALFQSGKLGLAIQLQPGQSDSGHFDFSVRGLGIYSGVLTLPTGKTGDHGDQTGIHIHATVPVQFFPSDGSAATPQTLRMVGRLDASHHTANVRVWVSPNIPPSDADDRDNVDDEQEGTDDGPKPYHLIIRSAEHEQIAEVVRRLSSALAHADWPDVYSELSADTRGTLTQADFIKLMSSAPKTVISVVPSGMGQLAFDTGTSYFLQPANLRVRNADGSVVPASATLFLVQEDGVWRFLSTSTPS